MIIYITVDNYFCVSAAIKTFLDFEMTANLRDTSPLMDAPCFSSRRDVMKDSPYLFISFELFWIKQGRGT